MQIKLSLSKSLEQNAEAYFNAAKKARKKMEGAKKTVEHYQKKLEALEKKQALAIAEQDKKAKRKESQRKPEWFHKFRWFISSQGFLVVAGRDATTNEIVIKKHMDKEDIVFHTEMSGSPFAVIKKNSNPDNAIGEATLNETAQFCASFSRAWKLEHPNAQVFHIIPEQVSKQAMPGEYMQKGSFMIYGKKNFIHSKLGLTICETEKGIMAAPKEAAQIYAKGKILLIQQGSDKPSSAAKLIKKLLDTEAELDEIIRVLPAGGVKVKDSDR